MAAVFAHDMPDLAIQKSGEDRTTKASTAKLVLLALADHANDEGKSAYPSLSLLQIKTSLSRPTLIACLDAMEYHGYISREGVSGRGTTNYTLHVGVLTSKAALPANEPASKATLPVVVKPLYPPSKATLPESSINHQDNHQKPRAQNLKTKTPVYGHPALEVYREVTHRHVQQAWRQDVADAIGGGQAELTRWRALVKQWIGRNYNPGNIEGLLDAWRNGGIRNNSRREAGETAAERYARRMKDLG